MHSHFVAWTGEIDLDHIRSSKGEIGAHEFPINIECVLHIGQGLMHHFFGDTLATVLGIVFEHLDTSAYELCEVLNRVVQMIPGPLALH